MDRDRQALEQFLESEKLPWVTLHEKELGGRHPLAAYYGINAIPTVLLVDKEGKVVSLRARGPELDRLLEGLLGPAERVEDYDRELKARPDDRELLIARGSLLARGAHWKEALADYDRALKIQPDDYWTAWTRSTLILRTGGREEYRRACRELAERCGTAEFFDPKPLLIIPNVVEDLGAPTRRAEQWVESTREGDPHMPWRLFARALAQYRAGQYKKSVDDLDRMRGQIHLLGDRDAPGSTAVYNEVLGDLLQAMARHQLGERDQSRQFFTRGASLMDAKLPKEGKEDIRVWWDWIHCQVLRGEAETLIDPRAKR